MYLQIHQQLSSAQASAVKGCQMNKANLPGQRCVVINQLVVINQVISDRWGQHADIDLKTYQLYCLR